MLPHTNLTKSLSAELPTRLFVPADRWGWRFVSPVTAVEFTEPPPARREVYPPQNYAKLEAASKRAWRELGKWVLIGLLVGVAIEAVPNTNPAGSIVFLLAIIAAVVRFVVVRGRFKSTKAQYEAAFHGVDDVLQREHAAWQARAADHAAREKARVEGAMYWDPVWISPRPARVEVFGGSVEGWASLLTTACTAALAQECAVLVLDLTEAAVADDLADLAVQRGHRVEIRELPECLDRTNLLADLDPDEIAELVAETVHTLQATATSPDQRSLHTSLVLAVAQSLSGPVSFARLDAGFRVLRRTYDVETEQVLSAAEFRTVSTLVDTVGSTEQARNEILTVDVVLAELARFEGPSTAQAEGFATAWPASGVSVIATSASTQRRKRLLDLVAFRRVLGELRRRRAGGRQMLVVAGGDDLGLESIEALARQARRQGVQLVMMMEHLREDTQKILGGADSATVIMRLANGAESAAAADFIGRGYRFVLSQLTTETGRSSTRGQSDSHGTSTSLSQSTGYSSGGGFSSGSGGSSGSRSWSTNRSTSNSRSESWTRAVSSSLSDSSGEGEATSRVYEYSVEPTTIQGLAPTAFVVVEAGQQGRRAVVGDCNPGICLLDRVADRPRAQ